MGALRVGAEIMADAGLEVEPWVEGAAVEELHLGLFRGFAEAALAFAFEPDFVIVDAVPALAVPLVAVAPLQRPVFEPVDEPHARGEAALLLDRKSVSLEKRLPFRLDLGGVRS